MENWSGKADQFYQAINQIFVQFTFRLEILVVDETYAGHYTCDCQYTGSVEPARAERILRVVCKWCTLPLIVVIAQAKVLPFQSSYTTTLTEGDRMVLRCQATGIPKPVTYWTRTGGSSSIIRNYGISKPVISEYLNP